MVKGEVVLSLIVFVIFFLIKEVLGDLYIVVLLISLEGYWLNLMVWLLLVDICFLLFNVEKIKLLDRLCMLICVVCFLVCIVEISGNWVNVFVIEILGNLLRLFVDICFVIMLEKCFWLRDWMRLVLNFFIFICFIVFFWGCLILFVGVLGVVWVSVGCVYNVILLFNNVVMMVLGLKVFIGVLFFVFYKYFKYDNN